MDRRVNSRVCVCVCLTELLCFLRASDRQAVLDSELKSLQVSLRELEGFLKWLQEAETTVNVLADASQREELSQDSARIRELKGQLEVSTMFVVLALTQRGV